eukprot:CAMPEP_0171145088 /NCGR_PEP_ID=MMETSP0766_2-20121228/146883_1 /TAXON_ID=439317 /ORGANISM="Gambierdiscus australes, Strain CAWD 149" /LENGTH=369 /DNA_ID=CAMNT_0011608985 /DNA_START=174 /DNA_END=1283 /DNA_ORIENTATION=-
MPTRGRRPEIEIYNDHWWPLEPPPYHHPGTNPSSLGEIIAVQALEDNYTAYWQSLPKYVEVSGLVLRAQQEPYFKVPWKSTVSETTPDKGKGELLFVCHHKTGVNVHNNIMEALHGVFTMKESYEPGSGRIEHVDGGAKVLHFIRDPVDMILSGYRYHQNKWAGEIWSWGHGRTDQDPQCFMCDNEDHKIIFDMCKFNCTYFELLNRVDENTGVVLEAVSARTTMTSMAQAVAAWADKDNVLQISMDLAVSARTTMTSMAQAVAAWADKDNVLQISMDLLEHHTEQTVACILKFLGLDDDVSLAKRLEKAATKVHDPDHVTSGLYDNTRIKEFLESHFWVQDFNALREAIASVYEHQAALFGCPATGHV